MTQRHHGFSLIEIAVVVVIISLIIGSIAAGRSLIRNSELRAAVSEATAYTQAISTFREKYKALPGDFATATSIWGAAHATASTCKTTTATNIVATCNGDGDGKIMNHADTATYYEQFRAWQHLSNAGLIEGNYTGVVTSADYEYSIGTNIPRSRLSGSGWKLMNVSTRDISLGSLAGISYQSGDIPPNVVLWLGGVYFEASQRMSAVMSTEEAYGLDVKIDDGLGGTGKLVGQATAAESCFNSSTMAYKPSTTVYTCALIFKTGL